MSECPSLAELSGAEPLPVPVAAHVRNCARCAALRRAFEARQLSGSELFAEPAVEFAWPHPPYAGIADQPRPGAVHSVWGAEDGELLAAVIMDMNDREALVVPVSPETHMAGDADVLIEASVLSYPAMIEMWNHVQVLTEQLAEQVGMLAPELVDSVDAALDAVLESEPLPESLTQGPALLSADDPRQLFRDREAERARKFVEPWRLLNTGETLGEILAARRAEQDLTVEDLSSDVDLGSDVLSGLEADSEDLRAAVAIASMASLVERLKLQPSRRLADLVERAVFENDRQPLVGTESLRARRRLRHRSGGRPPSEEVRREHARDYAERLLARMQGSE